jgi:hypothetical protein
MDQISYFPVFTCIRFLPDNVQLPSLLGVLANEHVGFHVFDYIGFNAFKADWS